MVYFDAMEIAYVVDNPTVVNYATSIIQRILNQIVLNIGVFIYVFCNSLQINRLLYFHGTKIHHGE